MAAAFFFLAGLAERCDTRAGADTMRQHVLAVAIAILTSVAGFPQTDDWRPRMNEGAAAEAVGDYASAASSYRLATEVAEQFDHHDRRRTVAWNAMATMYDAMGRFAEAEAAYRRALKEAAESTGKAGPDYALVLANLGCWYEETGQRAAGEKLLREALAIYYAADPPDELRTAVAQNALAEALCTARKYKEAGPLLTRALAVLEKSPRAWSETALAKNNLGVVRFLEGNYEEARRLLLQAVAMIEQRRGPDHPTLARILNNLASLENRTGHREEAGERLRRALDIAERRLGREHPSYAALLANYAAFLRQGGDKSRAKELEAQSTQILKDNSRRNGLGAVIDVSSLRRQ
jgi:tetratricopeptide (TPR) repeat protein